MLPLQVISSCKVDNKTIISGYVFDAITKEKLPNAKINIFAYESSGSFSSGKSGYYVFRSSTNTDASGKFTYILYSDEELLRPEKNGYFDLADNETRSIKINQSNYYEIFLHPACKMNVKLVSPAKMKSICIKIISKANDCEYGGFEKCYYNTQDTSTSCNILRNDTAKIKFTYTDFSNISREKDTSIYCPSSTSIDVVLKY